MVYGPQVGPLADAKLNCPDCHGDLSNGRCRFCTLYRFIFEKRYFDAPLHYLTYIL